MDSILDRFTPVDLGLYWEEQGLLAISDVHVGYEEALNKQGILVPRFQSADLKKRLEALLKKVKPKTVLINGDVKHEFGTISNQEWRDTLAVLDLIHKHSARTILVKGNHDTILGPIAEKREIEVVDHYAADGVYFCHGNVIPEDKEFAEADIVIIGHEHPAVCIRDRIRAETYKAFLVGKWKRKKLIVLPSFNLVTEGTDVKKESLLSPFLQQPLGNFEAYVAGQKILHFGKLKQIK